MKVTLCSIVVLVLLLFGCKHVNEKAVPSSADSTDYIESYFCNDFDEQEVTVENYDSLLESIRAELDTLSSPSRCVAPIAQMNAVLLKLDSITKPYGFMDRKKAYNDHFSEMLDSLEKSDADDPWNYNKAEWLVYEKLQNVVRNRISTN